MLVLLPEAEAALAGQKFAELSSSVRALHSTDNVCLWRLYGCVLDFIHLSATGAAEIAEYTHTCVYIGSTRSMCRGTR